MASYNRVILVGNLTRDIELKYTPGGTAVTDIGMAMNGMRANVGAPAIEFETAWARNAGEYLGKGSPILVEGRLKLDTWETDGQKRSKLRVVCDRMQMLSGGGGGRQRHSSDPSDSSHASDSAENGPGQREAQPTGNGPGYDDPDIPF